MGEGGKGKGKRKGVNAIALTFSRLPVPLSPFRLSDILAGCLLFAVCSAGVWV